MAYSPERKAAVLTKMLPPNNRPLRQLSQEEGISRGTLAKWREEARAKGQFLPDAKTGPEGWTSTDKLAAVIETAAMNETELGEYCRRRGLYPEQLRVWREACERANDWERAAATRAARETKDDKKRIKALERELARKEKALAEAAAQSLGMAFHELAMNAGKYGSLSTETGEVRISWDLAPAADSKRLLSVSWVERGGPPVATPTRKGFGTTLTDAMLRGALGGATSVEYAPEGLTWRLDGAAGAEEPRA